jgi:hypothetical protein
LENWKRLRALGPVWLGQTKAGPAQKEPIELSLEIRTRKTAKCPYSATMTAEAILQRSLRYDRSGKPLEVVIPYEEFLDFIETHGLDLTDEEKSSVREAKADREAGRMENFVTLGDLEKELGI